MTGAVKEKRRSEGQGPNWILIAGGALLTTLSIRLGYKLKQVLDMKQPEATTRLSKGRRSAKCPSQSSLYCLHDNGCLDCISGTEGMAGVKPHQDGQLLTDSEIALSLVKVSAPEYGKPNGVIWASSPDQLELPQKPFHHSNSSDSPCVSESGSDIFINREVIKKLRHQLKKRDDMMLEMQDQIEELRNSLNAQHSHSAHLQSLLDAGNRDLFDAEREIQRLRKAIADHCVRQARPVDKTPTSTIWPSEGCDGHANGYLDVGSNLGTTPTGRGNGERIEMLKREVGELREVIEGKEYLLQSYKEQTSELSLKIKELQQRLDAQLPNIL